MAQNPDPQLAITSLAGRDPHARRLDDGVQPRDRRAAGPARGPRVRAGDRADLRHVRRQRRAHRRVRAEHRRRSPGGSSATPPTSGSCSAIRTRRSSTSLGLERLPAFVHLRQDTSLVAAAQGWSPTEWQKVADELAKHQHWTSPAGRRPQRSAARARAGRSPPEPRTGRSPALDRANRPRCAPAAGQLTSVVRHAAADPPLRRDPARPGGAAPRRPRSPPSIVARLRSAAASPQDQLAAEAGAGRAARKRRSTPTASASRSSTSSSTRRSSRSTKRTHGIADTQRRLDAAAAARRTRWRRELASRAAALYVGAANGDARRHGRRRRRAGARQPREVRVGRRRRRPRPHRRRSPSPRNSSTAPRPSSRRAGAARGGEEGRPRRRPGTELAAAQDEQQALLAQNKGEIATLVAQIEAQKRAAEEAKARAEFQRKQAASTRPSGAGRRRRRAAAPVVGEPTPAVARSHIPRRRRTAAPAPRSSTAMAQIGKPYRYAGVGPGLLRLLRASRCIAWAAAGVRLPHSLRRAVRELPARLPGASSSRATSCSTGRRSTTSASTSAAASTCTRRTPVTS